MVEADKNNEKQDGSLVLPEELTISQAAEYYQLLMKRVEEGGDIELDAESVTRIDAAGVQLLFMVQRALSEAGNTLRWRAGSQALKESVALLGMSECLAIT